MSNDFEHLPVIGPSPIFIVQSQRTGCTLLYQALVSGYKLPYFCNFTNEFFYNKPEYGVATLLGLPTLPKPDLKSELGKTEGPWSPSEASNVMRHFFGGGHPSEVKSKDFIDGQREEFIKSITDIRRLSDRPIAIKNSWNSFRLEAIINAFPEACFIWSRRDIMAAAKSDFLARIKKTGSPNDWSSATPENYESLLKRPTHEHLVENQFEYARAISKGLANVPENQKLEIWYEDFVSDPFLVLSNLRNQLKSFKKLEPLKYSNLDFTLIRPRNSSKKALNLGRWQDEYQKIEEHVKGNPERYAGLQSPGKSF